MQNAVRNYLIVTASYWGFTLVDGALRMLVLLHFFKLGYSPFTLSFLFLLYEFFGSEVAEPTVVATLLRMTEQEDADLRGGAWLTVGTLGHIARGAKQADLSACLDATGRATCEACGGRSPGGGLCPQCWEIAAGACRIADQRR